MLSNATWAPPPAADRHDVTPADAKAFKADDNKEVGGAPYRIGSGAINNSNNATAYVPVAGQSGYNYARHSGSHSPRKAEVGKPAQKPAMFSNQDRKKVQDAADTALKQAANFNRQVAAPSIMPTARYEAVMHFEESYASYKEKTLSLLDPGSADYNQVSSDLDAKRQVFEGGQYNDLYQLVLHDQLSLTDLQYIKSAQHPPSPASVRR